MYKRQVEDHGPGISADDLPYIFDRYYRSRSDAGKQGTGPVSYTHLDVYKRQILRFLQPGAADKSGLSASVPCQRIRHRPEMCIRDRPKAPTLRKDFPRPGEDVTAGDKKGNLASRSDD